MDWRKLNFAQLENLLKFCDKNQLVANFSPSKKTITYYDSGNNKLLIVRLSIDLKYTHTDNLITKTDFLNHIILLVKSGIGSTAFFENGEIVDHKVFRAYMVRKKQGKSQIKYLKTKGKSRAGSRIRLQETLDFFEEINLRLNSYFKEYRIDVIACNSSKTLLPYLYQSKTKTPFEKNDGRLYKIPKHIASATHENLLEVNEHLFSSAMFITEIGQEIFKDLTLEQDIENDDSQEDNW